MKCEEFWESGGAAPDHLQECAKCAALHQREERVAAGLKALGAQWRRTTAPPRIERRLVEAFRVEMGAAPAHRRGAWAAVLTWGTAVAATVTLALVLVLVHGRQPQQTHRPARTGMELAAAETPVDVAPALSESGFIPLPNADQMDPEDEMDVVRMQVPRSALIALGVAVSEDEASEQVEADVVLGGDGVARAVRFLD